MWSLLFPGVNQFIEEENQYFKSKPGQENVTHLKFAYTGKETSSNVSLFFFPSTHHHLLPSHFKLLPMVSKSIHCATRLVLKNLSLWARK
jgi:hypothetical protein